MNTYGKSFRVTLFGESHGTLIGVVVDGIPAGLELSEKEIQTALDKRSPGKSEIYTPRLEEDKVEILSGIFNGNSTGAPITMIIKNKNFESSAYERFKNLPRPGHADYTAWQKYNGFNDYRGGGIFSGRVTAALVMAGAIAKKLLLSVGTELAAHTVQIGTINLDRTMSFDEIKNNRWKNDVRCADMNLARDMHNIILKAKSQNDSVGGIVECLVSNIPAGIGEPFFDTVEGELSKLIFAIPGVKGIGFGSGFGCAEMLGSEHNDQFDVVNGKIITQTNYAGGILGGITNGMPIMFQVAFKPTSSIFKKQWSVNLDTFDREELMVEGKHDPCIVPRAVPVIEACTAIVLVDLMQRADNELIKEVVK